MDDFRIKASNYEGVHLGQYSKLESITSLGNVRWIVEGNTGDGCPMAVSHYYQQMDIYFTAGEIWLFLDSWMLKVFFKVSESL